MIINITTTINMALDIFHELENSICNIAITKELIIVKGIMNINAIIGIIKKSPSPSAQIVLKKFLIKLFRTYGSSTNFLNLGGSTIFSEALNSSLSFSNCSSIWLKV